jgi:hypothetical protein
MSASTAGRQCEKCKPLNYCSAVCRSRALHRKLPYNRRNCRRCGKSLRNYRSHARCCSATCRKAVSRCRLQGKDLPKISLKPLLPWDVTLPASTINTVSPPVNSRGGGSIADQVREAQRRSGFFGAEADLPPWRRAELASQQWNELLAAMNNPEPDFGPLPPNAWDLHMLRVRQAQEKMRQREWCIEQSYARKAAREW